MVKSENNMQNNKLIIIKIGSNVLVDEQNKIREEIVSEILSAAALELEKKNKIMIVTSGAVALGRDFFKNKKVDKKLAAGLGQMKLMEVYSRQAEKLNIEISELLLSRPHLLERKHFLELQKTMDSAFANKIIPVVNENDALVYGTDWSFGDNDSLSTSLAIAFDADKLLIVSHVEGLYTADPTKNKEAKLISKIKDVNSELVKYCTTEVSDKGRGGMLSKLKAARLCTAVGIETQIVSGLKENNISKSLAGEDIGTIFLPRKLLTSIKNRERWILAARNSAASVEIDDGAAKALKSGKSLLAVGIKKVYGDFEAGDLVEVVDKNREGLAIGLVDIESKELEQKNFKLQKGVQLMHTDNIMVFDHS